FPDRAAASSLPPLAMPCLDGFGENRALRRFCRIAWHGIEAPRQLARLCVVPRDIAAHPVFTAAVADDDATLDDPRRPGDRVGFVGVDGHHAPYRLTR